MLLPQASIIYTSIVQNFQMPLAANVNIKTLTFVLFLTMTNLNPREARDLGRKPTDGHGTLKEGT